MMKRAGRWVVAGLGALAALCAGRLEAQGTGKIPITTTSEEARQSFLKGRDLAEKLRNTDARAEYEKAVARDPNFAMAYVGLANTAPSNKQFLEAVAKASGLAGKASEGERLLIQALEAGTKGNNSAQREALTKLVQLFPNDERALNQMGIFQFGQQDFAAAIETFQKAIALNPEFSQPYNMIGYAHRQLEHYADSEAAFKKYIALIPRDPNPHDSYAELLMRMGRFEDSIQNYRKALAIDPNFVASRIGIAMDLVLLGRGDEARAELAAMARGARNDGERRQARFSTAMSWLHEGNPHKALAELETMYAIAEVNNDVSQMANDIATIGVVLLETGRLDEAGRRFAEGLKTMEGASVPPEIKEQFRRGTLFNESKLALARKDLATARAKAAEFSKMVAARPGPNVLRQEAELQGRIALEEKNWTAAVAAFKKANQQDPQVVFLQALALDGKGDGASARDLYKRASGYNGINFPLSYAAVRSKARAKAAPATARG